MPSVSMTNENDCGFAISSVSSASGEARGSIIFCVFLFNCSLIAPHPEEEHMSSVYLRSFPEELIDAFMCPWQQLNAKQTLLNRCPSQLFCP